MPQHRKKADTRDPQPAPSAKRDKAGNQPGLEQKKNWRKLYAIQGPEPAKKSRKKKFFEKSEIPSPFSHRSSIIAHRGWKSPLAVLIKAST
jgi:hypothetical protein